jgi:integrase
VRKHLPVNPASKTNWKGDYKPPEAKGGHYRRMNDLDGAPLVFQSLLRASESDAGAAAWALMILTAARPSEALEASWSEFDLMKRRWTIPAARTKTEKDHVVPLSTVAMQILEARAAARTGAFVFEGRDGKPASYSFFTNTPKRVGVENTGSGHSWRSVFADTAADVLHVPSEVREVCLAHSIGKIAGAYRRETGVEGRAKVMERYATWLMSGEADNVVPLKKTA